MIWFEKDRIPKGQWPFLGIVYAGLLEIEGALEDQIDLTEGNGQVLITGCMRAYRQAAMRRVLDLAQAMITSWNGGFAVGAIVCARSLLETIATVHSFITRVESAATIKDWERIGRLVDAYAFSSSSEKSNNQRSAEAPPRIGRIVKDFLLATQPGCEHFWHQICDSAHPNGKRMMDYSGVFIEKNYYASNIADEEPTLFAAVFNALHSCCWLMNANLDFDILLEVIRNGGALPADHHLIVQRKNIDQISTQIIEDKKL